MSFENGGQGRPCMTAMERALLLALLLKWSKEKVGFRVEQARELEKKIWLSHIQSAIEQEEEEELLVSGKYPYMLCRIYLRFILESAYLPMFKLNTPVFIRIQPDLCLKEKSWF